MVERFLAKEEVAGSNPVPRSANLHKVTQTTTLSYSSMLNSTEFRQILHLAKTFPERGRHVGKDRDQA